MDDPQHIEHLLRLLAHGTRDEEIDARNQLGEMYFEREQWDLAAECFEGNISEGVRTPEMFGALAMVRIEQGRVAEASRLIHAACELADEERMGAEQASRGAWHWLVDQGTRPFRLAASLVVAMMGHRHERSDRPERREQ